MVPGEKYPVHFREYETEKGTLTQAVKMTSGWQEGKSMWNYFDVSFSNRWGSDLPLMGNEVVNRSLKFLVENEQDAEAFTALLTGPTEEEVEAFFEEAEKAKKWAEEREILLEGGDFAVYGATHALSLCGGEKMMVHQYRRPEMLRKFLSVTHEFDMNAIRLLGKVGGIDVIHHHAWYENGEFWSPPKFREFIAPILKKAVEESHRYGMKYCFICTIGLMSIIKILQEMGVDILLGVDPVQGNTDLRRVKEQIGEKVCLWGGVSSAVTLGFGTKEKIDQEAQSAVRSLGPGGGFILAPIDQLWPYTPWENIQAMIEAWRTHRGYPIRLS